MKIDEILCEYTQLQGIIPPYGKGHIDFDEFLKKKWPIAYNSSFTIYRGVEIKSEGYLLYGDSRLTERVSANTDNYYTQIIDNILPEWEKFPKRSRSFICTNEHFDAMAMGRPYRVYPVGDPLIGICPYSDLWISFKHIHLGKFARMFEEIEKELGIVVNDKDLGSIKNFIKYANENFDKIIKIIKKYVQETYPNTIEDKKSFMEVLEWILDPISNSFRLARLSQIPALYNGLNDHEHEFWFSGPAYFVSS